MYLRAAAFPKKIEWLYVCIRPPSAVGEGADRIVAK